MSLHKRPYIAASICLILLATGLASIVFNYKNSIAPGTITWYGKGYRVMAYIDPENERMLLVKLKHLAPGDNSVLCKFKVLCDSSNGTNQFAQVIPFEFFVYAHGEWTLKTLLKHNHMKVASVVEDRQEI
jgi:hypothetical protein